MFLPCVCIVVLKLVISLTQLQLCCVPAPTAEARPACSWSSLPSDTASSGHHSVGLCLGISAILISLPVSAAILLFSLKTLRSLSDGILDLDKVLIKSKLDRINQIKCEGSVSPWCCMFLVVSVEGFYWICLEIGCFGFKKVGAHLFMFWIPFIRLNLF